MIARLRYIFRLVTAFISRFKALMIIGILAGIAIFFVLRFVLPLVSESSATKVGLTGRYTPSTLPASILEMVGQGLTKIGKDGSPEPDLASSWETPDGGKTWIFTLRNDAIWQDGKKVTSTAINYQFSDVTINRPNDTTIEFKLQNAYSPFPAVVSRPVFKKGLLGTGEWEVKNLSLAGSYVDQVTIEKKSGEKIIYKFYPTEEDTKLAFEMGQVDEIKDVIDSAPLNSWPKIKIAKSINTGEYVAIFFNTQDKLLSDKNLRQALSYAINKDKLGDLRAISPISIDSWAYNPQVKPYNYDLEKAKSMIDDIKKNQKSDEIKINLTTPPILYTQAESVAKDWEACGVSVNLQVLANIPSDYQSLLAIFDIPDDPDQYSIWHSTQTATNVTHYSNPRIDKLLEDGRSEISMEDRKKTYFDFQRYLVEDSPAVFLYYPTTYTINRK